MKKRMVVLLCVALVAGCAQVGNVVLKLMTAKESDLEKVAAVGLYQRNLISGDIDAMTIKAAPWWEEGTSVAGVMFVKKEGIGFVDLQGVVTIDGDTAFSSSAGMKLVKYTTDQDKPKKVRIVSQAGQTTEFMLNPPPKVKIKKVNGATENPVIDLTKDLSLDLELDKAAEGKRLQVSILANMPGGKDFTTIQNLPAASKVTIPAGAFRNLQVGGEALVTIPKEGNWLRVETVQDVHFSDTPHLAYHRNNAKYSDAIAVQIEGDISGATYRTKGSMDIGKDKKADFSAMVPNGYAAGTLGLKGLRVGVASVSVAGVLYQQQTKTEIKDDYFSNTRTITTTITTYEFPQLDDAYWNQYLENIYADVVKNLKSYGVDVVDIDKITASPSYAKFREPEDKNTKVLIKKNLRNSRRLIATNVFEIMGDAKTSIIADKSPQTDLLNELDLDAYMNISIDLRVGGDEGKVVLFPTMSFQVFGWNQARDNGISGWYTGQLWADGVPFSKSEFTDLNALNRIAQKDMLVNSIDQSMKALMDKQKEGEVDRIWKLAKAIK